MTRKKEIEKEIADLLSSLTLVFMGDLKLFMQIVEGDIKTGESEFFESFEEVAEDLKQVFILSTKKLFRLKKEYSEL